MLFGPQEMCRWARDDAGIAIPLSYRSRWRPGLESKCWRTAIMTDNPISSAHQKCRRTVIKRSGQEGDCGIAWSATVTPPRNAPRGGIEPPLPGPREPTIYGPLKVLAHGQH